VVGGLDANGVLRGTTETYDPKSNSWSTLSPEPKPVVNAASAAFGSRLIVAGGSNGTAAVTSVQVYDFTKDSWSTGTSLPTAIVGAAGAGQRGTMFLEGGGDANGNVKKNLSCGARHCGGW
jgi:N-acetylneuraminic acid mutarotase